VEGAGRVLNLAHNPAMTIDLKPRRIPGTELDVSRLILGAMTFGSQVDEPEAQRMVDRARGFGVTMFDTANTYTGGRSEEILGRVVKPFRSDILLATKVGQNRGEAPPLSRQTILKELDDSLRRLGTDYIDVYYLHQPDARTPFEETLACLDEVVRAGKIRAVAQSNFAAWQITECHSLAARNGWPKMQISQQMYSLLARRIEEEYRACAQHLGLFNIAYNPLAGGLLSGKHRIGKEPEAGSRFSVKYYQARYWNQTQFHAVERLRGIAADAGMTLIELSYRWLLSRPTIDCVLVGASTMQHLEANLAAAAGAAPDQDTVARIDDVWATLRGIAPAYNR
jgi:aryl-alcohol dehydrogenase-like predicted oxidoreductase